MKITVKKLQGGECNLEVSPTTTIAEIKQQVFANLTIPVDEQKILLAGRTLADENTVASYPAIKEGCKLNLVVKKPEDLYEASVRWFKTWGMTDAEAADTATKFIQNIDDQFYRMSWDDFDRLAYDCLLQEGGPEAVAGLPVPCDDFDDMDRRIG